MNLGIGASKRSSIIDIADKDSDSYSDSATLTTPQQPKRKIAGSSVAAEVLGLNYEPPESPSPKSTGGSSTPRHAPARLHLLPTSGPSVAATNSSPPSPPEQDSGHAPDGRELSPPGSIISPSTSKHLFQSSSSTSSASSTPRRPSRRHQLSRVSDQDADPMAGDWDPPTFGRTLSPIVNGNGGDEFDSGDEGEGLDESDKTRSSATDSPKSATSTGSRGRQQTAVVGSPGPWGA